MVSPGEDVFLVVSHDNRLYLYSVQEDAPKMEFEMPNGGVSGLIWADAISGDFLVASPKDGALRLYNAASPAPKNVIRASRHPICGIVQMNRDVYFLQLRSGQVCQFDIRSRKNIYSTLVGHSSQI